MKKIVILIIGLLITHAVVAQITVDAKIDSVAILIGQQARMTVGVTGSKGISVVFPEFKPSQHIIPGVEVLGSSVVDTTDLDNGLVRVSKIFTLTSFDEHLYAIPGMNVRVNGKMYRGNPLALKVLTVDVDTLHPNQFFPPKDVQDNPFQWAEWSTFFWLSVLVVILCGFGFYLCIQLRQNKPIITRIRIVKRILPHQRAMSAIEKLKEDRLPASEDQKTYYTKLTETLRQYIEDRFGFNAMEMTSAEIISHLQATGDQKMIDELRELFATADLVKFAKYSTLINENDANLLNAVHFIDETKLEGEATTERIVPKLSAEDLKTKQLRITIKSLIYAIAVIVVALLSYVVYGVSQLLIPYLLWYFLYSKKSEPTMKLSDTYAYRFAPKSWRIRLINLPMVLRCLTFVAVVIVLSRPQTHTSWGNKSVEGIDIMLAMDVSTSMLAEDLSPNRMEAAKDVAAEFIAGRPNDNIGLTIFAGEAFTQCPMTTDHASLLNLLHSVRTDIAARGLINDGTAIGMGLANAVSRLKESKAKSKVVILLTDGSNNTGDLSPMTAAQIAKSLGIRVYTIGVGTNKVARYPMPVAGGVQYVNIPVEIDTKTLSDIAAATQGNFYRATNNQQLKQIYKDIDKLEKSKMDVKKFSKRYEAYQPFALVAILLLLLEILLRTTVFRRIP